MRGTEVTLGRFRNDTTAAEDLQQVVFKFPEFNKLLSREGAASLMKIAISKAAGVSRCQLLCSFGICLIGSLICFFKSRITLIGHFYSCIYFKTDNSLITSD